MCGLMVGKPCTNWCVVWWLVNHAPIVHIPVVGLGCSVHREVSSYGFATWYNKERLRCKNFPGTQLWNIVISRIERLLLPYFGFLSAKLVISYWSITLWPRLWIAWRFESLCGGGMVLLSKQKPRKEIKNGHIITICFK